MKVLNTVENIDAISPFDAMFSKVANYTCVTMRLHVELECNMSCSTRKPSVWTLRNVSNQISLRSPRRQIRADTFRLRGIEV